MRKYTFAALVVVLGLVASGQQVAARSAPVTGAADPAAGENAVLAWNAVIADATLTSGISPLFDPLHESRLYAMVHVAIHDGLNAIERRSRPYALDIGLWPDASPEAAVAAAAHTVLVPALRQLPEAFPSADAVAAVRAHYRKALEEIPNGEGKRQGVAIGRAAGAVVNAMRAADGSNRVFLDFDYPEGDAPGEFRFVEDAPFAVAPRWGEVTPFVMNNGAQYRPGPPLDVTSKKYAADFDELKSLGDINSTTRTTDQTHAARFWFEGSPLRWNRIARTVAEATGLDLWDSARLFGLLGISLADGYIGNWDAKYHYNFWRPETAVHFADTDGNPRTVGDPTWTPLWGSSGATPEYDSGHAIEGAAAAEVFRRFFRTDDMTFSVCSYTLPTNSCTDPSPTLRTYTSFSQAAEENALSRIWLGWHFRDAVEVGLKHGTRIGGRAINRFMQPVHSVESSSGPGRAPSQ